MRSLFFYSLLSASDKRQLTIDFNNSNQPNDPIESEFRSSQIKKVKITHPNEIPDSEEEVIYPKISKKSPNDEQYGNKEIELISKLFLLKIDEMQKFVKGEVEKISTRVLQVENSLNGLSNKIKALKSQKEKKESKKTKKATQKKTTSTKTRKAKNKKQNEESSEEEEDVSSDFFDEDLGASEQSETEEESEEEIVEERHSKKIVKKTKK